ncbi:MAG: hypothetical protein ACOC14_03850 [Bacillota bacterium]
MKKIVFLLSICLMGCFQHSLSAESNVAVDEEVIDGVSRLVIEGTAHHPYRIVRGDEANRYVKTGHETFDGLHAVYGYGVFEGTPSHFDGFLMVFDETGTILLEETLDFDHLEEVMDVHLDGDVAYVHLRQSVDNRPDGMIHRKDYLLEIDGETVNPLHETSSEIQRMDFERGMVYFSETYQGHYEKGYDVTKGALAGEKLHGLEPHGQYRGEMVVHSFCETALFEGETFTKSHRVDYPGHYTLECDGTDVEFTVNPEIEGVELNGRALAPVALSVSGGRVWLNDDLYIDETLIERPGYHTLRIEGANDYLYTAHFTLESGLEGVEDGGVYSDGKTLFFSGEGRLNDESIASGHTLKEPGSYTLRILGQDDYEEVVSFEIQKGNASKIKNIAGFELGIAIAGIVATGITVYIFFRKR